MASVLAANLTLTTVGSNVTINVTYNAVFSVFERFLASHGLRFYEKIYVFGIDPPGAFTGTILKAFPAQLLPVTAPPSPPAVQTIPRNRSITVPRAQLQEDTGLGDADEIRCRVVIDPIGMPASVTGWTDQEVLLG